MRAVLNRHMFTARVFDSGAIGVLASLVHQFAEPGRYEVVIRQNDVPVRSVWFEVAESSANMQLDIDLATPRLPGPTRADDCECASDPTKGSGVRDAVPTVSPRGYVLFYVSHGEGGYAVRAGRQGGDKAAFDSETLGKGDIFAVSLLAPTRYAMANRTGKAHGTIVVAMSREAIRNIAAVTPIYVDTARDSFSPNDVKAVSGQGIVFRIVESSRVVIEQLDEPAGGKEPIGRRRVVARRPAATGQKRGAVQRDER